MPAYVNYRGEQIGLVSHPQPVKAKPEQLPFHKGWRVIGVPPAALRNARKSSGNKFDEQAWLRNAKREPLRSRPYGVHDAALECASLARKGGWLCVEVVEIKSGEAPKGAVFPRASTNRKATNGI